MAASQKVNLLAVLLVLCQLYGLVTSQQCQNNYTIGSSTSPVIIITQSTGVCLICFNTTYTQWSIGASSYSGISGSLYVLYIPSPTTTFIGSPTAYCYSSAMSLVSSIVHVAVPVSPTVLTYVNETDTLSLDCTKVVTVSIGAIGFMGQSWLRPNGSTIAAGPTATVPNIYRTNFGNYTCSTTLITNANSVMAYTPVTVYYPPTTLSPQPIVYMAQGRSIQLTCTFDGLPVPDVTWTFPNGSAITNQSRFLIQSTATSTTLIISSLIGGSDNGTYSCYASNFRGTSMNTTQLIVQVPPNPPSNLIVTAIDNSSISLSWTNGFDGFSPLINVTISYEVDRYPQLGTGSQNFSIGTSATLTKLYPYSNYTIHVRLINAVGLIGNRTDITATTVSLRPMAPTITSVVAMNSTQMTVTWMSPIINSSTTAPVTSWTLIYTCFSPWNPSSCPSGSIPSISPSSTSLLLLGLVKGSIYTFQVYGVNSGGVGDYSLQATNQTLLDPPTAVRSLDPQIMSTTSVLLTWTPPADNGGQNISYYFVQYGILSTDNLTNLTVNTSQTLLTGLAENSWYRFSVTAHNGFSLGGVSWTVTLLIGNPIMPKSVSTSGLTDTYVTITWDLRDPFGFIDNFLVNYRLESSMVWTMPTVSLLNDTFTYLLTGLSPNTTYVVGVATKNRILTPSNYTTTTITTAASPYLTGPSKIIYAGIPFNITCNLEAGYPGMITWAKVGSSAPLNAVAMGTSLVFSIPKVEDTGSYTCSYVDSSQKSMSFPITIQSFTPSISGPTGSTSTTVTTGTSFTLTCDIGTGYTTAVIWSKVGSTSLPSSAKVNGSSLVFTNPQPGDSGSYICSFLGPASPSSAAFVVSISDDITMIIIIVVVVGGVALLLLLVAISVLVCYCCFCRNAGGYSSSKVSKWTAPVETTKAKPTSSEAPPQQRPHLTSFHTPAKPTGTLMHQGAITDELPESYSGATTFGTVNRQSSQLNSNPPPYKEKSDPDQLQYAALSFGGGNNSKPAPLPQTADDSTVTYSTVIIEGGELRLLPNEERNTSASPEGAPVTSMV